MCKLLVDESTGQAVGEHLRDPKNAENGFASLLLCVNFGISSYR